MILPLFDLDRLVQSPLAFAALATSCFVFCLGMLSVKRERGTVESLTFLKLTGAIGLWLFGTSWMYASGDADSAYWWAKICHIGIALIPAAGVEFNMLLMQDFQKSRKQIQFFWAISIFFLIIFLVTDFQFNSMYRYDWGFYPRYTLTSIPFLLYFFATMTTLLGRYIKGWHAARPGSLQQKQGRLVLLAYIVSNVGFVDFLPTFGIAVYPFGFGAIIIFTMILFYSTWRYRFIAITPSFAAESMIQIMGDGLMVVDNEGFIRVANNSLRRLFHLGDGIIGMRPSEVVPDADGFGADLENLLQQDELQNFEIDYRDENGSICSLSLTSSFMHNQLDERVAIVCVARDVTERKKAETEREQLISQLKEALANVRQLSGLLPICAQCKKIRDDQGYWQQIESYIRTHSGAEFTHGLCPECAAETLAELRRFKTKQNSTEPLQL